MGPNKRLDGECPEWIEIDEINCGHRIYSSNCFRFGAARRRDRVRERRWTAHEALPTYPAIDKVIRMNFLKTSDGRAAGLVVFAVFITLAIAAQGSAMPNGTPTGASYAPIGSSNANTDQHVAPGSETAADSVCEKQHWPYYSKECLRGEGSGFDPRQVHLQRAAVEPAKSTPLLASSAAERRPTELRLFAEAPPRRKVRQTPQYASRRISRPQVMQREDFEQQQP